MDTRRTSRADRADDRASARAAKGAGTGAGKDAADPDDPPEDPEGVARQILLRRLTDQPRSRSELAKALARKRVPDEVAGRVLDRFEEVGLVDDAAFARSWVETRQRGRGLARRALAHELRGKGVDSETAREALDDIDPDDERATAARLVRRRLPSLARQERAVARRRLVGMLARKGYSSGVAMAVVDDELAAARAAAETTSQDTALAGDMDDPDLCDLP